MIASADKGREYYSKIDGSADGQALTEYTADAGGGVKAIVDSALTEADDYWNGAFGWFDIDTTTTALQGQFFHVLDFTASSGTLTLAKSLPAAPAAGDTFRLIKHGGYRSTKELYGMMVDGAFPEEETVSGSDITGLTIKKASGALGAGTLTLFYNSSLDQLFAKMDAGDYGAGLDVSGDVTDGIVFIDDGQAYVQVDVTNASLPVADQSDEFEISKPERTFIQDVEASETNFSRYALNIFRNTDAAETMVDLSAYVAPPVDASTDIATGESLGTTEANVKVDDASSFPTASFWILNEDANSGAGDVRAVQYVSGNDLHVLAVDWGVLSFDTGSVEIVVGDTIEGGTSGATGIVDQIEVTSGAWGTSDAAGTIIVKSVTDDFDDNEDIKVSSSKCAESLASDAWTLGFRGYAAVTWNAGETLRVIADVDLAVLDHSTDKYTMQTDSYVSPDGLTYGMYDSSDSMLSAGDLVAGDHIGFVIRETIPTGFRARKNIDYDVIKIWG